MRKQVLWVAIGLLVGLAVAVYAQPGEILTVQIPYNFTISGKQLPAGPYEIQRSGITGSILIIRSEDGKNAVQADIVTRISTAPPNEGKIVLDKFEGDKYALSEVFFPGEDGFLLAGSKNTPHKHEMIKAKTKKA